jgi:hypothetical protein
MPMIPRSAKFVDYQADTTEISLDDEYDAPEEEQERLRKDLGRITAAERDALLGNTRVSL